MTSCGGWGVLFVLICHVKAHLFLAHVISANRNYSKFNFVLNKSNGS